MLPRLAATVILWVISGALALSIGLALASAANGRSRSSRLVGHALITLTRGVPTSLLVIIGGLVATRLHPPPWLPDPFPGTQPAFRLVAWAIVAMLAFGSTGHFAVIFQTAYQALDRGLVEQARVLGIPALRRALLLGREAAPTVVAPTGARLTHHLHNTAFAALFPVAELFGWIQERANATFAVTKYVLIGMVAYILMTGLIWVGTKTLETKLTRGRYPAAETAPANVAA